MKKRNSKNEHIDYLLLVFTLALLAYGLLMLYSATFYVGVRFWRQQLVWILLGSVAMVVMMQLPYPLWRHLALPAMFLTLFLLFLVLFLGEQVLGAQRSLLGASVQPGILARLVAVIYIAAWLASKGEQLNQVHYGLVPFAVITGIVAGFVALQPDLSTALLVVVTGVMMFFFAGGDPIQIFLSMLMGSAAFSLLVWRFQHARSRLVAYMQSLKDPAQMPYHVQRAVIAIGEGGIFGVGIGSGRLKSGYLPFPHTDSVFAVIGEEMGFFGALLVLLLFGLFAYRGYRIAISTPDAFGSLLAFGVTTMILSEALLNIMVMVGVVPFTGTALPFFSYGGSEMLVTLSGVGLLLGVSRGCPRRDWDAVWDSWRRDWGARLSRLSRRTGLASR
ncbi:MAG: FtsW/RodA/SpoVE family cell cycle protein [Anaerolineae bacterium]|nr:FtsW/RodA/SpoVE family cell cycle protein [Anaerolineae bacterium]